MEHFEKSPGTFEKHMGPTRTPGEPFVKNPTDLVPLFCAPQVWTLLRNFSIFGWDFTQSLDGILLTHKCHWTAKHQHSNQVQSDSLPSVSGDVISGTQKMLKKGICKRHVIPSRKFTYPKFSQMFQKNQETYSFWLLGNAKNPTELKPYWSRAGLRHPDFYCWK
jgi:hypothetical protein